MVVKYLDLKGSEMRDLTQLQFTSWPDHGVPTSPAAFLDFVNKARNVYDRSRGPTVVHCRQVNLFVHSLNLAWEL